MDLGWIAAAFVAGLGARALRQPPLVGYLVAGMVLAAFGAESGPVLDEVAELGVALLLFVIGIDLRWRSVFRPEVTGVGTIHLLVIAGLSAGGAALLGVPVLGGAAVGVGLGVSSLVLAAKTLEDQHDLHAFHGRVAIGLVLFQTVVGAVVITALSGSWPAWWSLGLLAMPLLRRPLQALLGWIARGELLVLFGLLLAVAGSLVFELAGLSAELGALLTGSLLAGHERTEQLEKALWSLKEAFIAAFFVKVGLVGLPSSSGVLVVLALLGLLLVKGGLFFGLFVGFKLRARSAFLAALPLTTFSGFTLVVASVVAEAGLLPEVGLTILAVATVASYVINAPVSRIGPSLWRRLRPVLIRFERDVRHLDARPVTLGHTRYLVIGMGRAGTAAYDALGLRGYCVTGIDPDPARLEEQRKERRRVFFGDARDAGLWEELDLSTLDGILLALPGHEAKVDTIEILRASGYTGPIFALTTSRHTRAALKEAGASAVYISIEQAGQALAEHAVERGPDTEPETVTLAVRPE